MALDTTTDDAVARHLAYPDLEPELRPSDFQRRRVQAVAAFVQPGDAVLDVGCNSGYFVDFVPPECRVSGVDVSADRVLQARERLVVAEVARAEELPFPDKSFDVVVVSEILEHVHDPLVVMQEAARVARRCVIGSTPTEVGAWAGFEGHAHHVRCFTRQTLRELMQQVGTPQTLATVDAGGVPQCYVFEVCV